MQFWFLIPALPVIASIHPAVILPAAVAGILNGPEAFLCSLHFPKGRVGIHVLIGPESLFIRLDCILCGNVRVAPVRRRIIRRVIRIKIILFLSLIPWERVRELLGNSARNQTENEGKDEICKVVLHYNHQYKITLKLYILAFPQAFCVKESFMYVGVR